VVTPIEEVRASVARQLEAPLPKLLDESPQTQAEWRERVTYAERCLWGASVIMAAIGLELQDTPSRDPLEISWWHLYDLLVSRRATWPEADRADFDNDRPARRNAVWADVLAKLARHGLPKPGHVYAAQAQAQDDTWPRLKYEVQARYGREKGRLEVRDPFDGTWLEIDYQQAPQNWKRMARDEAAKRRMAREADRARQ
jgi:hypothetical protein